MAKHDHCRMCKSTNMQLFLDLGFSPPSDAFLTKEQLERREPKYPLNVYHCSNCGLCQLGYVVPPELMYNENYPYESSITKTGREHFANLAKEICNKFDLSKDSLVIDVGSNVGILLSGFKKQEMRVLGIEPSINIAKEAIKNDINSISEFFSSKLAFKILDKEGKASVITGTNVFAHIDDLHDFVKAVDILLTDYGVLVIEAPYLEDILENLEYDTIYHEHLSYFAVKPVTKFFNDLGWEVFDIEKQSIHGGTLRYFIGRKGKHTISKNIKEFLILEKKNETNSIKRLKKFAKEVSYHKKELMTLLLELKKQGKKIAGISAPAKGNTLLNYCKIGPEILDYVTEKSMLKIGKFTPGTHIPIYSDTKLLEDLPDYGLILAWNFADDIIRNNKEYQNNGGKFIISIPHPKII